MAMAPLDRRLLLQSAFGSAAALALGSPLWGLGGFSTQRTKPKALSVVHIHLEGGLSHLDSFDPKPYAPIEVRGNFGTVASKLQGEPFSKLLARTAKIADRLCVIRSMTHGEAAHERGLHTMLTGYKPSPAITYPSLGSVFAHQLGPRNHLPPYIAIPTASADFSGTGYLSAANAPFSVGSDPVRSNFKVRDLQTESKVKLSAERIARRRRLLGMVDEDFGPREHADSIRALEAFYDQAYALIDAPAARKAFNINEEPRKTRDRYGRTDIGQRLLLARRLVEAGARYILVGQGGYDNHRNIGRDLKRRLNPLDLGYSSFIRDLEQRGLLDQTLVVLSSEFGRTPRMNKDGGRDHWAKVFSVALAGGGIKRGLIHGSSDSSGGEPDSDPVSPPDLAATIFSLAGIDPTHKLMSPGDRPIDIVRDGKVLKSLLT